MLLIISFLQILYKNPNSIDTYCLKISLKIPIKCIYYAAKYIIELLNDKSEYLYLSYSIDYFVFID